MNSGPSLHRKRLFFNVRYGIAYTRSEPAVVLRNVYCGTEMNCIQPLFIRKVFRKISTLSRICVKGISVSKQTFSDTRLSGNS